MIFYVEDDSAIRELVIYTLESQGMKAEGFADGEKMLERLVEITPELILLDIMLEGEDGLSILKNLKANAKYSALPVILVTAKGNEFDKVHGLDLGADDYVSKPFGMMELVARVKAVLRRNQSGKDERKLELFGLSIDDKTHKVLGNGNEIVLTLKEFELLKYFMKNVNVVLTRENLLANIWGYDYEGETRTVDVHIRTLRSKLGEFEQYVQTVRGVGYKFGETN